MISTRATPNMPPIILGGETHNSAPASATTWTHALERARALNLDTVLAPVTWELLEPQEGVFDFSIVDRMIAGAHQSGLRLIPLWFGAFKNGMSTYAPTWVRFDHQRFPRACSSTGQMMLTLSPLYESTRQADALAFAALVRHCRQRDPDGSTVCMFQVENEVGLMFAPRDRSLHADTLFSGPVPAALLTWLDEGARQPHPWMTLALRPPTDRGDGSWAAVFNDHADEIFMAWHFAMFVEAVAAAGQQAWNLPCFTNAWLLQYPGEPAGDHPTGGPMAHLRDVWQAAAPSLLALAPDIYLDDAIGVCRDYSGWQPLLIPEMRRSEQVAARIWYACGEHGARLVSPFGFESLGLAGSQPADGVVGLDGREDECSPVGADLVAKTYALLREIVPTLGDLYGTGAVRGLLQSDNLERKFDLGGIRFQPQWKSPFLRSAPGAGGLIASIGDGQFLVAGFGLSLRVHARIPGRSVELVELWDGICRDGSFIRTHRLNGDEHQLRMGTIPSVRMVQIREIG